MVKKTLNTIIVLRNDSSTDWANSEVILKSGELGISYLDNGNVMVKAGNGVDKFADLPQVESVLEAPMMLTYSFGKHSVPAGGSLDAGGTGMTMSQWIADALKKTVEPTIKRYPNASLSASCSNSGASLEIGSYITSVSECSKRDIIKFCNADEAKIRVIPNAADRSRFRKYDEGEVKLSLVLQNIIWNINSIACL